MRRIAIVNSDDFGRSHGVNAGVIAAHERGIVTSASLMVRWPAATEAAAYARRRRTLGVGLHLDLGEWRQAGGDWQPVYEVVDPHDAAAVAAELQRQLTTFQELLGQAPTHLDSHQHVHRLEPARSALIRAGAELGVPVRDAEPAIRYSGSFYAEGDPDTIGVQSLVQLLEALGPGATEVGCHPGLGVDFDSAYGHEREREVATLCDPRVRATIEALDIELRSFADLVREAP